MGYINRPTQNIGISILEMEVNMRWLWLFRRPYGTEVANPMPGQGLLWVNSPTSPYSNQSVYMEPLSGRLPEARPGS